MRRLLCNNSQRKIDCICIEVFSKFYFYFRFKDNFWSLVRFDIASPICIAPLSPI